MSASMLLKFYESVRGRFKDFLEAECLVGDICTNRHKAEEQVQKHKNKNTNLISVKLVHKNKHKVLKEHKQRQKIMLIVLNM